jgi:hypothetical protein
MASSHPLEVASSLASRCLPGMSLTSATTSLSAGQPVTWMLSRRYAGRTLQMVNDLAGGPAGSYRGAGPPRLAESNSPVPSGALRAES